MFELHDYQKKLVSITARKLAAFKRIILCAPTGSGKTVMFSDIIRKHLARNLFNRTLILTHRTELFSQTLRAVVKQGTDVSLLQAGDRVTDEHHKTRSLVAMVETMKRRDLSKFGRFSLVIVDEAHRADFNDLIGRKDEPQPFEFDYLIGATATPISSSKKKPLIDYYSDIALSASIRDLIEWGRLSKPVHYMAKFDDSGLRKRRGEYTMESQMSGRSRVVYENTFELWERKAGQKKTIMFNVNKADTIQADDLWREKGIRSTHLLSGDSRRAEKLRDFENGTIQVLHNCEIGTTGLDVPSIEAVAVNVSTASISKWLQMVGRAARVVPGLKDEFTVLDFGGNIDRHGLWNAVRDWEAIFRNPKEALVGPAPYIECQNCGALLLAATRICEFCGTRVKTAEEREKEKVRGYLEEVGVDHADGSLIDELTIKDLYHLELAGRYKPAFIARIARTRGGSDLAEYARLKGYRGGWVKYQSQLDKGYTNRRVQL